MKISEFFSICLVAVNLLNGCSAISDEPLCQCERNYENLVEKMIRTEVKVEQLTKLVEQNLVHTKMNGCNDKGIEHTMGTKEKSRVVFSAKDVSNLDLNAGDTIMFRTVLSNLGDGYNNNSGVFVAPIAGVYLFTVHLCGQNEKTLDYGIKANGKDVVRGYVISTDSSICTSFDAIVYLEAGSRVMVQSYWNGDKLFQDGYRWNVFSGALLN